MHHEPPSYRGIDFVIKTRKSVDTLTAELAKDICFNQVWKGTRTLALTSPRANPSIETDLKWFCAAIENLSAQAKLEWHSASSRAVDIGIDSGTIASSDKFTPLDLRIRPALLKRMSEIDATLVITVYPLVNTSKSRALARTRPKPK